MIARTSLIAICILFAATGVVRAADPIAGFYVDLGTTQMALMLDKLASTPEEVHQSTSRKIEQSASLAKSVKPALSAAKAKPELAKSIRSCYATAKSALETADAIEVRRLETDLAKCKNEIEVEAGLSD